MRASVVAGAMLIAAGAIAQPAPPRPLMLFFDWGKPDIRSDDQAVLDQAAAAYRELPGAHFEISGHSDRSGSAAVNRAAALRRAATVRGELVKRGIPRNAIRIASFGEDQPLVPTEDGVREVQNRRVEIRIER